MLVSADSDFGTILAASRATRPSVLYLRGTTGRRVEQLAQPISAALPSIEDALTGGSLVVIEPTPYASAHCPSSNRQLTQPEQLLASMTPRA